MAVSNRLKSRWWEETHFNMGTDFDTTPEHSPVRPLLFYLSFHHSLSLHLLFCLHGAGLVTCFLPVDLLTVWKTRRGPKCKTTHGRQGNKRRALFKLSWMIQKTRNPDKPKTRHADKKKRDKQQKRGWNKSKVQINETTRNKNQNQV